MSRIIITIDHKWRDLPGAVYAGILLEKKGHKVKYVRQGLEKYYVSSFKPDMIVMNHLHDKSKQLFAQKISMSGIRVVLLPTEGIPTLEKYRKFESGINSNLSGVAINFAWNETMAQYSEENPTFDSKNTYVIGVPRFDFYQKPLDSILKTKKEFCEEVNFNVEIPIVTFATNFTQAPFHTQSRLKEFLVKDAEALGYNDIMQENHGGPAKIAEMDFESQAILMDAFMKLVKANKNINFILKLHPSEDRKIYQSLINSLPIVDSSRIVLITTAYIWDVLKVSDILLKRSCTTGIEAWFMGKPTIEMKLNPHEWYYSEEHASGSDVVESYEELNSLVNEYINGRLIDESKAVARDKFITKWCYKNDANSTKRMVELIDETLKIENIKNIKYFKIKNYLIHKLLLLGDYFIHDIRVYGLFNTLRKRYIDKLGREDKYFHKKDIRLWKEKIAPLIK